MDLGATRFCTPRQPACDRCPWQGHCAAYACRPIRCLAPWKTHEDPCVSGELALGVVAGLRRAGMLIDQRLDCGACWAGLNGSSPGKQEAGEAITATDRAELGEGSWGFTVEVAKS